MLIRNMTELSKPRLLLLLIAASSASAINLPFRLLDDATPVDAARAAEITQAPSPVVVDLLLERHQQVKRGTSTIPTLLACATPCIESAVTKSTNCQVGDHMCECETNNAQVIEEGAYSCINSACGGAVVAYSRVYPCLTDKSSYFSSEVLCSLVRSVC